MPWGGHPQGAPLPFLSTGGAPRRTCLKPFLCPGEGAHGGLPIRYALGRAPTRGAPTDSLCPEGAHKGNILTLFIHKGLPVLPWAGAHKGCPYRPFCPGEGAHKGRPPMLCPAHKGRPYLFALQGVLRPGEGAHKGCPYRFFLPWGGRPQGVPLPIRFALGRAPTRGAPTDILRPGEGAPRGDLFCPGEGTHKGCPYRCFALGRAPTRGAPTDILRPGEGAHKGCPYRYFALGRAPTRGAPTDVLPWGGRPQGVPLPMFCPGEGTKGCPFCHILNRFLQVSTTSSCRRRWRCAAGPRCWSG